MWRIAPVFLTANLAGELQHYRRLVKVEAYNGADYGYAYRDGIEIHIAKVERLDPRTTTKQPKKLV